MQESKKSKVSKPTETSPKHTSHKLLLADTQISPMYPLPQSCPTVLVQDTCNVTITSPDQRQLCASSKPTLGLECGSLAVKRKTKTGLTRLQKQVRDRPAITVPETVPMDVRDDSGSDDSDIVCGNGDKPADTSGTKDNPEVIASQDSLVKEAETVIDLREGSTSSRPATQRFSTRAGRREGEEDGLDEWDWDIANDKVGDKQQRKSRLSRLSPVSGGNRVSTETEDSEITSPVFGGRPVVDGRRATASSFQSPSLFDSSVEADNQGRREVSNNESPAVVKIVRPSLVDVTDTRSPLTVNPPVHNPSATVDTSLASPSVLSGKVESTSGDKINSGGGIGKLNFGGDENAPLVINDDSSSGRSSPACSQDNGTAGNPSIRRSTRSSSSSQKWQDSAPVNAFSILTRKKIRGVGLIVVQKNGDTRIRKYKQSTLSQAFVPPGKKENKKAKSCEYNGDDLRGMTPEEQEEYLIEKAMQESLKTHPHEAMSELSIDGEVMQPLITSTPMVKHQSYRLTDDGFKKPPAPCRPTGKSNTQKPYSIQTVPETESTHNPNTDATTTLETCPPRTIPQNLSMDPDVRLTQYDASYVHGGSRVGAASSQMFLEPVSMLDIEDAQDASEKSQAARRREGGGRGGSVPVASDRMKVSEIYSSSYY